MRIAALQQIMLDMLLNLMGPERIALGTDYPFPLGELSSGKLIDSMSYDVKIKERLFSGTALEWLGLNKEKFISGKHI